MLIACRKRRVPVEDLRFAAERIERDLYLDADEEVSTQAIGDKVLAELSGIDPVAYVRFASVYREFETLTDFQLMIDLVYQDMPRQSPLTSVN